MEPFEETIARLPTRTQREELRLQLAWLAGLLEAEGTFLMPSSSDGSPRVVCYMGDEDVVGRVARIFGTEAFESTRPDRTRVMYTARIGGQPAALLMRDLSPLMGGRRSNRIRDVLDAYEPPARKLDYQMAAEISLLLKAGISVSELSRRFSVSRPTIRQVREGSIYPSDAAPRWRHGRSVVPSYVATPAGISPGELFWLAGWLEGEGSFCSPPPSDPRRVRISGCTTDEDVARAVARLFRVTPTFSHTESCRDKGWSPTWKVLKRGSGAVELMKALYPLMGERRQGQIVEALAAIGEGFLWRRREIAPASAEPVSMRATSVPIGV